MLDGCQADSRLPRVPMLDVDIVRAYGWVEDSPPTGVVECVAHSVSGLGPGLWSAIPAEGAHEKRALRYDPCDGLARRHLLAIHRAPQL